MAHAAMAGCCPGFDFYFKNKIDGKFLKVLTDERITGALQWASTLESTARTPEATQELLEMLRGFNASDEEVDRWLEHAEALYRNSQDQ